MRNVTDYLQTPFDVVTVDRRTHPPAPPQAEFRRIYEQYIAWISRVCARFGIPPCDIDDVLQETFLAVSTSLPGFRGDCCLATWIFRIAFRKSRDHQRRRRKSQPSVSDPDELAGALPTGFDARARTEQVSRAMLKLSELDDRDAAVLVLYDVHGLTGPEVAERLGMNLNTVYSKLRNARSKLKG